MTPPAETLPAATRAGKRWGLWGRDAIAGVPEKPGAHERADVEGVKQGDRVSGWSPPDGENACGKVVPRCIFERAVCEIEAAAACRLVWDGQLRCQVHINATKGICRCPLDVKSKNCRFGTRSAL